MTKKKKSERVGEREVSSDYVMRLGKAADKERQSRCNLSLPANGWRHIPTPGTYDAAISLSRAGQGRGGVRNALIDQSKM